VKNAIFVFTRLPLHVQKHTLFEVAK